MPLATGLSPFEAKVLAARLGADGIIWQMRGIVDGIYPIGEIDVLVPASELDDARVLLEPVADIDLRTAAERGEGGPVAEGVRRRWWTGALLLAFAATFLWMRLLLI